MENAQPPLSSPPILPVPPAPAAPARRRHTVTLKLLFIASLVLLLQLPLKLINDLREERSKNFDGAAARLAERRASSHPGEGSHSSPAVAAAEGYRMVERALKHSVLILTLTFTAFFLFETLAGLRLHAVHYGLVGAALCLFYLALLALGERLEPGTAYVGAAVASSVLIVLYSVSVLRSYRRAGLITALLTFEHGVLFVVLRMEDYALLAGTASLFVALGALMYATRNVDWFTEETNRAAQA
jgi:inner membrane protein involved in colicin E2 resistance